MAGRGWVAGADAGGGEACARVEGGAGGVGLVGRGQEGGAFGGGLQGLGDHDGDRLGWRSGPGRSAAGRGGRRSGRVLSSGSCARAGLLVRGHDVDDAGVGFGGGDVEAGDAAAGDAADGEDGVEQARGVVVGGVGGRTGDLEVAVAAGERLADAGALAEVDARGLADGGWGGFGHGQAPGGEGGGRQGRQAGRRAAASEGQGADDDPPGQLDLEFVVPGGRAAARARSAARRKGRLGRAPARAASAVGARQGLRATPPRAMRAPAIRLAVEPQAGGGGDDGEGVGGAFADFEVAGVGGERGGGGGEADGGDEFAGGEDGLALGGRAGEEVEVGERDFARAVRAFDLDDGVEGGEGDAEVGRVGGDAVLAPAEDGVEAVLAAERVAAGTGIALVAGAGGVVEIGAAGALEQVAGQGGGVAELRRGAREQGFGDGREAAGEGWVVGQVGVADQGADAGGAVRADARSRSGPGGG